MSHEKNIRSSKEFSADINRLGRLTSIIALIAMFAVPLGTAYYYNVGLDLGKAFAAASSLIAIFLPTAVAENLSFYPIFGSGAMYLSSITGNITNMKLPVTVSGQKIANAEAGTEKGDIIAIITVGISSMVTILILIIGAFLIGSWLVPILEHPVLKPGFDHITPALYGAITVPQIIRNPKLALVPLLYTGGFYFILGADRFGQYQSYILLSSMLVSVLVAYFLHRRQSTEEK